MLATAIRLNGREILRRSPRDALRAEPEREIVERLVEARGVAPRAEQLERAGLRGRSAARRGRRARRRRGAGGRSSRTRASPSARTSRAGSGSRRAPRVRSRSWISRSKGESSVDAIGHRPVLGVRVRLPARRSVVSRDAERAEAQLLELALGLGRPRAPRSRDTSAPRGPRAAGSPGGRRRDLAEAMQDLEHHRHVAVAPPAVRRPSGRPSGRPARARAAGRSPRAPAGRAPAELPVRGQEFAAAPLPRVLAAVPPRHARRGSPAGLDRPDERVPLEELPLLPQQPVELGRVEAAAEPAPENEPLRRRDRRDRVELQAAEPARRSRARRSRCRRAPGRGRDAPRLLAPAFSAAPPRARSSARAARAHGRAISSAAEARTPLSRWKALTTRAPSRRSDFRSARPTIRSRQRKGST